MATTYTLISSNVLTGSAASVTFSSIPSTYTDLVLRHSSSTNNAGAITDSIAVVLNSDTATNYSFTLLYGDAAAGNSARTANNASLTDYYTSGTANTNVFASHELYFPNYLSTGNRPISVFGANEGTSTAPYPRIQTTAGLYRGTSAISSISLTPQNGTAFLSGSSFYLYGIKNS